MAIYQSNGRGSLVIERRIRGLGKFRAPSGCPDSEAGRTTAAGMEQMVLVLAGPAGRRDVVKAIMKRQLHLQDVWPHYTTGRWDRLPTPEHLKRLFPLELTTAQQRRKVRLGVVGQWLPTYRTSRGEPSPGHRRRLLQCFRRLEQLNGKATVGELPALVRAYREVCEEAGYHREFQLTKAAAQAFLRSTLGRRSNPLWGEVADIPTLKPGEGESTTRVGRKWSPAEARAWRATFGPVHGRQWWEMCCTGMMPDEYFGRKFTDRPDRVEVRGTKRRHDDPERMGRRWREVPRLTPIRGPASGYDRYVEVVREKSGGAVVPYDARHTFAHWMQRAKIDPVRRDVYRGHSPKTMRELYEEDRTGTLLAEDAVLLLAYFGPEPEGSYKLSTDTGSANENGNDA